jgi:hypothetical protein
MYTVNPDRQLRLSEREAATYLGPISIRTLQDWRVRGIGPAYTKLGKRVAYDVVDLDAYVARMRVEPKQSPSPKGGS